MPQIIELHNYNNAIKNLGVLWQLYKSKLSELTLFPDSLVCNFPLDNTQILHYDQSILSWDFQSEFCLEPGKIVNYIKSTFCSN